MGLAVKVVARVLWIYSFATLSIVLGVAAVPGVLLARWAWSTHAWGSWILPDLVHVVQATVFTVAAYFVTGLVLMLMLPILRFAMGASTGEGTVPIRSFKVWSWYNYNGLILAWQTLFGKFWRSSALYVLFLRAMGAKIGHNVIVNSNVVYDHDMLDIGDNTVIGGDAAIIGHVGEKGHLVRAPIRIGRGCTIGQYTTVFPGATLGDNCHVGAMSLVPKGATLEANAVYGGVPVRKLKSLRPGERSSAIQDAEPEALAMELDKADEAEDEANRARKQVMA